VSRFRCACGRDISDVQFPCSEELHVISDKDLDYLTNYATDQIDAEAFGDHKRDLLECSKCGRLHLQKTPGVNEYVTYAKEVKS
jgi:hypothetical protein